jgi:hypothetical protein
MDILPKASEMRAKSTKYMDQEEQKICEYIKDKINEAAEAGRSYVYIGKSRSFTVVTGLEIPFKYINELRLLGYKVKEEDQDFSGYKVEW